MFGQRDRLQIPIVCVGAAFDFYAGTLRQAPAWMQKRGLEWAFRLGMEPRRLWRRYARAVPLFLLLFGRQYVAERLRGRTDTPLAHSSTH
jgi:N-acetylglucosaminyldiphosphoundecaprenol N-acetyl-beta-D-mannosaminyltransferase